MCHTRGDFANCIHLPRLSGGPATQFFGGEASLASPPKQNEIKIIQLNANGIRSTVEEPKHLMRTTQPDVVAIQESKLTPASRTPKIPHYTAIRTDREHKQGGGLITYIKSDTTLTHIKTPQTINTDNTEIRLLKIHTKHFKDITIANIYIAPRNTTTPRTQT